MGNAANTLKRLTLELGGSDAAIVLPGKDIGPIQNANQSRLVTELVKDAVKNGGRVVSGGQASSGKGYFYPPTIVAGVSNGMRLVEEEQFGPVFCPLPLTRR